MYTEGRENGIFILFFSIGICCVKINNDRFFFLNKVRWINIYYCIILHIQIIIFWIRMITMDLYVMYVKRYISL